jgi:hypothetical protein
MTLTRTPGDRRSNRHLFAGGVVTALLTLALTVAPGATTAATAGGARDSASSSAAGSVRRQDGGWGYVTEGRLRMDPNLGAGVILTIVEQWVNVLCWVDGGPNGAGSNRWFKVRYYDLEGYMSSGVVSHQPAVGHC